MAGARWQLAAVRVAGEIGEDFLQKYVNSSERDRGYTKLFDVKENGWRIQIRSSGNSSVTEDQVHDIFSMYSRNGQMADFVAGRKFTKPTSDDLDSSDGSGE